MQSSGQNSWQKVLVILGITLLVFWSLWWGASVSGRRPFLLFGKQTWVPAQAVLGFDFIHSYTAARTWLSGGDPYQAMTGDPLFTHYSYAPQVLPFFAWSVFFEPNRSYTIAVTPDLKEATGVMRMSTTATIAWALAIAALTAACVRRVWRLRQQMGVTPLPWVLMIAAALLSTPVVFEMERGNCNILALALMVLAAWLADGRRVWWRDIVAGVCLALALYIKSYVLIGFVPFVLARRYRPVLLSVIAAALLAAVFWRDTVTFVENLRRDSGVYSCPLDPSLHPLATLWPKLVGPAAAGIISGKLVAAVLIGVPLLLMMVLLWRMKIGPALLLPAIFWFVAAATYLPPLSNDYNYIAFILLALAVWDRRDPVWVHVIFGAVLLWWQPFALPIHAAVIFWIKLAGLYAGGFCLLRRARDVRALS